MALIENDQKVFSEAVNTRLNRVMGAMMSVYPAVTGPPPSTVQAIVNEHVAEVSESARMAPVDVNDLM